MKKALIAGAASAVLAAMPVMGAFAATQLTGVVDTVTLSIDDACKMEAAAAAGTYNLGTVVAGNAATAKDGTPMTVTCNTAAGWTLTAKATDMTTGANGYTIPYGQYAGGSQSTSVWSAQFALSGDDYTTSTEITTGNNAYATNTILTSGDGVVVAQSKTTNNLKQSTTGVTITPSYIAYVDAHQNAGNYSGTMTYTFVGEAPVQNSGN